MITATPHSCDVERLISSHYQLKTLDRSSLSSDTLNDYLHVNLNMTSLADFNVWPAVQLFLKEKMRRGIAQPPLKTSHWYKGAFQEAEGAKVNAVKSLVKFG